MRHFFLFVSLLISSTFSFAQHLCGFDQVHQARLTNDPEYAKSVMENELHIQKYIQNHPELISARNSQTIYTIPVVVHVIHTGGPVGTIYNPSDDQIINAIKFMNDIYSGALPWVGQDKGFDVAGAAKDVGIRFVLAKRDPNCNPTNGIVRYNASANSVYVDKGISTGFGGSGLDEGTLKNLSKWDQSNYYNIWVVNKINGADGTSGQFIAGFAYFPNQNTALDGTVLLATSIREDNKILTHELGHAFDLYHPFQGSNSADQCPSNSNCVSSGDRVCDTDPISYNVVNGVVNFSCRTEQPNSCAPGKNFSPLTENNFMNYTNCFTLFTNGQKARMTAAMSLSSRVSLINSKAGIPTDQAPVCSPKVNFATASATVQEAKEIPVACYGYKDYNYSLSIASAPSGNVTVTLAPGGTATQGVDYLIYTQNNMTVPSNTITFSAGSAIPQSFTIRVLDDADVEGIENLILNMSVSGGGALLGEAAPSLNVSILDNDLAPLFPNAVASFTTGDFNTNIFFEENPFRAGKLKHRLQTLFLASELTQAGIKPGQQITGLALNVINKNSTTSLDGFSISIAHTTVTNLNVGFRSGLINTFTGNIITIAGENRINFTTPFTWDGTRNIAIQFCFDNTSSGSISTSDGIEGQSRVFGASVVATCAADYISETAAGCSLTRVFNSPDRPFIKFYATVPGNPVASSQTSDQEYLGPNANVYFFNSSGDVLARIKNLSSFDYGCTTVQIDRAGNGTVPFWNAAAANGLSQKSFLVTPQNPNPNGSYEISLYYSAAEKSGYEMATVQSWSTVQMVKSNGAISSITPTNQQASTVTVNTGAVKSTYGSDHVVTATFNNGFSGFAVGSPGAATSVYDYQVLKGVKVYPNPVGKQINIGFEKLQRNVSVRMMTADGRVLYTQRINGTVMNHALMVDKLNQGIYLLEINSDEGKKTIPVIKQ
jgi:hypothetical protein